VGRAKQISERSGSDCGEDLQFVECGKKESALTFLCLLSLCQDKESDWVLGQSLIFLIFEINTGKYVDMQTIFLGDCIC
jgi:hypothetical protein